jgi:hypothetical protein
MRRRKRKDPVFLSPREQETHNPEEDNPIRLRLTINFERFIEENLPCRF